MKKFEVGIEYGPTAADVHYITVEADDNEGAMLKAAEWAKANKINGTVNYPLELAEDDDFTEIVEWSHEEEEEFLHVLDDSGDE